MPVSIRHQSRMFCVQCLYEWDFKGSDIDIIIKRNLDLSEDQIDKDFAEKVLLGIVENIEFIDNLIKETAPEWPLEQIAVIDKTVLRLGIYELMIARDVPPKAVINEAVELGKEFGSESSGKFVNGVLGTIYRNADFYVEEEEENYAGGLAFKEDSGEIYFALMLNQYDRWTLPKIKVDPDETWQEAATRALQEKIGLETMEIIDYLGELKYSSKKDQETPQGDIKQVPIKKISYIYLIKTSDKEVKIPNNSELGVLDVDWFNAHDALEKIGYENAKDKIRSALDKIKKGEQSDGF